MIRHAFVAAASAAALLIAVPAFAADLPAYEPAPEAFAPVPSFTWTGPYVGAQAGYSWGRALRTKPSGFLLGGYAGYNYQFDNSPVVAGLETDFNYADIDDKSSGRRTKTRWTGATRARLGYAFDRFLVYGAAGVAYADRDVRVSGRGSDSTTAVGWTVGGGVESAVTDNVIVRAEYRYSDFGKDKFDLGNGTVKSKYDEHRVMGGVAYKFSTPTW